MRFPLKQTAKVFNYIRRQKGHGRKRFPIVLMLEPLHACNFTCSGCGRIREYKDHLSEMVQLGRCLKAVDDCGAPVVSICGGEPLMYPEIAELVRQILLRGRVVYLCTNGYLLEQKLSIFEPHPLLNINVHVDGLAVTHDAIVEKKGAFDRAVSGILAAKKKGFTVCTNTTLYDKTDAEEILALVDFLDGLGVDGILLSPSFDFSSAPDQSVFMVKDAITKKFRALGSIAKHPRVWSTPLFLDFVSGRRDYPCTPWGNVTYNILGWKAPCYLITDGHHASFDDFISKVEWDKFGPGRDARCLNCMVHCGFEPTVALTASSSFRDAIRMASWTLF